MGKQKGREVPVQRICVHKWVDVPERPIDHGLVVRCAGCSAVVQLKLDHDALDQRNVLRVDRRVLEVGQAVVTVHALDKLVEDFLDWVCAGVPWGNLHALSA